jgi:uncharacterized damage-inducible protein DinB
MSATSSPSPFNTHLLAQYDLARGMLARLASDFSEEDATRSAGGQKPLVWYLGHVAITDNYFLQLFGGEAAALSDEYIKRYGRGSDGESDFSDASKADVVALLETLKERVHVLLGSLAPEDLARESGVEKVHPMFKTLGSALTLVVAHCAYHAGQVGDLRRELGKDPLFG